jgi:hypothetical protein
MGASFNPEGEGLPGLPPLPSFPAELPITGGGMTFTIPGAAPATTTGIGLGGNELPSVPTLPSVPMSPGPNTDLSQFTPTPNSTIDFAITTQGSTQMPFASVTPPPGAPVIGGSPGATFEPTDFAGGGQTTISPNISAPVSTAQPADPFDPQLSGGTSSAAGASPNSTNGGFIFNPDTGTYFNPDTGAVALPGTPGLTPPAGPGSGEGMPGDLGSGGTGGITADFFQTFLNALGRLMTRFALVVLGVVLLGVAVWYFGAKDVKDTVARAVR